MILTIERATSCLIYYRVFEIEERRSGADVAGLGRRSLWEYQELKLHVASHLISCRS
jgi:hypothetical protein